MAEDGVLCDDFLFCLLIIWEEGLGCGGGLADNAPKYEQLNINRNAICCSPTNTHRDGGNKGNG